MITLSYSKFLAGALLGSSTYVTQTVKFCQICRYCSPMYAKRWLLTPRCSLVMVHSFESQMSHVQLSTQDVKSTLLTGGKSTTNTGDKSTTNTGGKSTTHTNLEIPRKFTDSARQLSRCRGALVKKRSPVFQ